MQRYEQSFLAGHWQETSGNGELVLHDSYTGAAMASVRLGDASLIAQAVRAAREAFEDWSRTPVAERARLLRLVADHLSSDAEAMAQAIMREVGMPLKLSRRIQVDAPIAAWRGYATLAETFAFESSVGHSLVVQVPVGVVACITPWNYPLHQITAKVAAALAAGCTVVLKPSELAPSAAYALARAIDAAGFPPGVFNLVMGEGPVAGEALVADPGVDMVSFTGSTRAGRRVAVLAMEGLKRVALELGGKSASVVLADADLDVAMKHALGACFLNSGQTCTAITRLLVPESAYDACVERLRAGISGYRMGDPSDPSTRLGPLVSAAQRDSVKRYVTQALAQGAEVIATGQDEPAGAGFFVAPIVLGNVQADQAIVQEEVFGPVLCVMTYSDEEQAIRMANDTDYGLAAAVWAGNAEHAMRVARRLRAGQIDVNGAPFNPAAPFGGFRHSGLGRENGHYGLAEFLETISIQQPLELKERAA